MKENMMEKLQALANEKEFMEKTALTNSVEELLAVLAEYGVQMTVAELEALMVSDLVATDDGELSEDALDDVSGGGRLWNWIKSKFNSWFKKQSEKNANDIANLVSGL